MQLLYKFILKFEFLIFNLNIAKGIEYPKYKLNIWCGKILIGLLKIKILLLRYVL